MPETDKYKEGQRAKEQRAERKKHLYPFLDERPAQEVGAQKRKTRQEFLEKPVSANIQFEQQAEQEEEQQEQEEQQEEQQAEAQAQREANIQALKDRVGEERVYEKRKKENFLKKVTFPLVNHISQSDGLLWHDICQRAPNPNDMRNLPINLQIQIIRDKKNQILWGYICSPSTDPNKRKIIGISPNVEEFLIRSPDFFKSGISLDEVPPPPGFILYQDEDNPNDLLLDYSENQYEIDLQALEEGARKIYPVPKKNMGSEIAWVGDAGQFGSSLGEERVEDAELLASGESVLLGAEEFEILSSRDKLSRLSNPAQINLFIRLLRVESPNFIDKKKEKLILEILSLDIIPKDNLIYNLATLVNKYGAQGPYCILTNILKLKNKFGPDLAQRFIELYIIKPPECNLKDFDAFLDPDRLRAFNELLNLSENEFQLFVQLSENEVMPPKPNYQLDDVNRRSLDLRLQAKQFFIFKEELKKLGIDLSLMPLDLEPHHKFQNQNMSVMMQRMLTMVKKSIDPIAQFKRLPLLNLTSDRAYQAICEEGYHFVAFEMGFEKDDYDRIRRERQNSLVSRMGQNAPQLNSTLADFLNLSRILKSQEQQDEDNLYFGTLFLRLVGKGYNADHYQDYLDIYGKFRGTHKKFPSAATYALALTAFASIHNNAYKIDPALYDKVVEKLMSTRDSGINWNSLLSYLELANQPQPDIVKRPQLEQLLTLIDFHVELGQDHSWNTNENILINITQKLGPVYFDVIHVRHANSTKLIMVAEILCDDELLKDADLLESRNNLFKILSDCNLDTLTAGDLKNFIKQLKQHDRTNLNTAIEFLKLAKYKTSHPTFDELNNLLTQINNLNNPSNNQIIDTIQSAPGFTDCYFGSRATAQYSGDTLKNIIQENLADIRGTFEQHDIPWDEAFENNPRALIEFVMRASEGNLAKRAIVRGASYKLLDIVKSGTQEEINNLIISTFPKDSNSIIRLLNENYFSKLSLKSDIDSLIDSTNELDTYKKGAQNLINILARVQAKNPVAFKNSLQALQSNRDLNHISLDTLTQLFTALSHRYGDKFPSYILKTIVTHPALKKMGPEDINALFTETIISDLINNPNLGLSKKDLNAVIHSVIALAAHPIHPHQIKTFLRLLINNTDTKQNLIRIFNDLSNDPKNHANFDNIINLLTLAESDPELKLKFYAQFEGHLEQINEVAKLNLPEKDTKNLLIILSKTKYEKNNFDDLLQALPKIDKLPEFLAELAALSLPVGIPDPTDKKLIDPYPSAQELIEYIQSKKTAQEIAKIALDKIEKNRNDPAILDQRFNTDEVFRVLNNMKNLEHDTPITYTQKHRLLQQFNTVNHLGRYIELSVNPAQPNAPTKHLTHMEDSEIKHLLSHYRTILSNPNIDLKLRNKTRLIYLALLRESMYRTTGRTPRSTQIIAVLNALNQEGNVISEIQTGQGKSMIAALKAAMQQAEGQTVDVCTANEQLAKDNLKENKSFYNYIGVKTGLITENSEFTDHQEGGIYYSDVPKMALFLARGFLAKFKFPRFMSLILDEADYTILDDRIQYRQASSLEGASTQNKFAFIYPLINAFIDDETQAYCDAQALRDYLLKRAPPRYSKIIQDSSIISDKQLNTWIGSAFTASEKFKEKKEWRLKDSTYNGKPAQVAELIINDIPAPSAQWARGIQQFLHARINQAHKKEIEEGTFHPAPILPETAAVVSLTSKNFIDFYKNQGGKIWGMTGTIGSFLEKAEQVQKFGLKLFSIPPHTKSNRFTHAPVLVDTDEKQKEAILNQILRRMRRKDKMPILIFCKDPVEAEALHKYLAEKLAKYEKYNPCLQLASGKELTQTKFPPDLNPDKNLTPEKIIDTAGENGSITISTPMFGRGTDFKPKSKYGLCVIQTYVDILRIVRQAFGRAARGEDPGEAMMIISKEALDKDLTHAGIIPPKHSFFRRRKIEKEIEAIQKSRDVSAEKQRKQNEVLGDIKNLYFKKMLILLDDINPDHKAEFLRNWERLLNKLDREKSNLLSQSPPPDIESLALQLLTITNKRWEKILKKFPDLQNSPEYSQAAPLPDNSLKAQARNIITPEHEPSQPPTPSELTEQLSTNENIEKLVHMAWDTPNQKLVNRVTARELEIIHSKAMALFKTHTLFPSRHLKAWKDAPNHWEKHLSELHCALHLAYREAYKKNRNSPKVQHYDALIIQLNQAIKWHQKYSPDKTEKQKMNHLFKKAQHDLKEKISESKRPILTAYLKHAIKRKPPDQSQGSKTKAKKPTDPSGSKPSI